MANVHRDVAWLELHGRLYHLCTRVVCLAAVELSFSCLYASCWWNSPEDLRNRVRIDTEP